MVTYRVTNIVWDRRADGDPSTAERPTELVVTFHEGSDLEEDIADAVTDATGFWPPTSFDFEKID